ncbi:MAG: division/cell wall cluster transcriptional repressor MraZ [Alphaproteobacteria bacterium]
MALFLSTFVNKVDRKGRVSVPAPFRAALAGQVFNGIVAFRSYKQRTIEASGIDRMASLSESLDEMELFSEAQDDLASTIFADAHRLPFDGEGRIVLSPVLAEHAGITDMAAFVGCGATFQIWEPEAFRAHQEQARARARRQGATLRLRPRRE